MDTHQVGYQFIAYNKSSELQYINTLDYFIYFLEQLLYSRLINKKARKSLTYNDKEWDIEELNLLRKFLNDQQATF